MKNNNNDNGRLNSDDMLKLIEEGNYQGKSIEVKVISARDIARMVKSGWKFMKIEPEGEILRCYFARE